MKVILSPAQIVLLAALLAKVTVGKAFTVVVIPALTVEQPLAVVTFTVITCPFVRVVVVKILVPLFCLDTPSIKNS